jgi:hypothetical protein
MIEGFLLHPCSLGRRLFLTLLSSPIFVCTVGEGGGAGGGGGVHVRIPSQKQLYEIYNDQSCNVDVCWRSLKFANYPYLLQNLMQIRLHSYPYPTI